MALKPWSLNADGVVLTIRLTPRSARDAIGAIELLPEGRTALAARVRAVPSGGEANAALIRLLARTLGVPTRDIVLAAGASGRLKRVVISGDGQTLVAALERLSKTG